MKNSQESSSSALQASDIKDAVVQYDDGGAVMLAVVIGTKKDKLKVLNLRGREVELAKNRLHLLPGKIEESHSTTQGRIDRLQAIDQEMRVCSQSIDVSELWAFVHDDIRSYSSSELCELYFGKDSFLEHGAIRLALIQEKVHFKRAATFFEPRPASVVEELKQAELAKTQRAQQRELALTFMERRVQDPTLEPPEIILDLVQNLKDIAAQSVHMEPGALKETKDFLRSLGERLRLGAVTAPEKLAFAALEKASFFDSHTNLSFVRHRIPLSFSEPVLEASRGVSVPTDNSSFRLDYTQVEAFTIDDDSTQDMDDALSIERTTEGYELGIHITDVSEAFPFDSILDEEARKRATSIYCADRTVNMLPESLSEGMLSLKAGEVRPCLSVFVSLSEDLALLSSHVKPTLVKVATRYSYDQVDDMLEHGDITFLRLYEIASIHEARRIARGAVKVHKREVVPHYRDSKITLQEIDEDSPARNLVAEMMVLANSVLAQYAIDNKIPVLFRAQESSSESNPKTAQDVPEGPAKEFQARMTLKKSTVSVEPAPHAGLGLSCYIQCTSPIRRYMDLCHQRQFVSFLRYGHPALTTEAFLQLANEVEGPLRSAMLASRETKRYWLLAYLAERDRNLPLEGTVVRTDLKSPLVELDEVFFTVLVKLNKEYSLGSKVALKVCSVDPHADYVRLQEA